MGVSSDSAPAPKPPGAARVILTVFLYLGLNSSLNLLNRYTLGMAGFKFPVSLTCMHLTFQICALAPIVLLRSREGKETHRAVVKRLWRGLFAIGTFMAVNISLNNASLLHLSLSYNQVIRASIPVVCAACSVVVEKKVPTVLEAVGLSLVAAGVMATVAGSSSRLEQRPNEVAGLIFCVVATVSNALMMTFSGKIMGGEKLDAVSLTFYTSPVVLGLLLPVALGLEWEKMTMRLRREGLEDDPFSAAVVETPGFVSGSGLLRLVFLGCCNAVVYNWVHNKVIAMTSATTTTVLGNVMLAPADCCSWFRSSTAPSESMPASISGTSASTTPPAVRFAISSTDSNDEMAHATRCSTVATDRSLARAGAAMLDKKAGTAPSPSMRPHCTGITPTSDDARGSTAACSAPRPCARPMRPNPDAASIAAIRSAAAPRAAMPTSAHAPHCTLAAATPCVWRDVARASRHAFAAA